MTSAFLCKLLTAPGYFQAHTGWAGVAALRSRAGEPECVLHPDDAAARGLTDGRDRGALQPAWSGEAPPPRERRDGPRRGLRPRAAARPPVTAGVP